VQSSNSIFLPTFLTLHGAVAVFVLELEVTNMSVQVPPRRSSTPCISFDFGYTKSVPQDADAKEICTITSLVMTDSASGYIHVTPFCVARISGV
jgi:hypothetical protein